MSNILEETRFIMKKYNIKANKNLGQNFLIKEEVVNKIVEGANLTKEDLVIEIGPGLGTLTKYLLEEACKVICIELDKKMLKILNDRFSLYNNFEIINNDVLKVDINSLIRKEKQEGKIKNVKVVANLPYYITTPIIMKLLEEKLDIDSITVMIQKEVADRLIATPGDKQTGAITYSVYYYCTSEKILEVPNDSFIPEPEVTSEVIKLNLRKEPPVHVENKKVLFMIIKSAFIQRRKTLLNALANSKVFLSKEEGIEILDKLGIDQNARAEQLTLESFARIATEIIERSKNGLAK
jgi:16S rRNA (adenine1518-N6/adenine1519-N6)-dimethyltransferase